VESAHSKRTLFVRRPPNLSLRALFFSFYLFDPSLPGLASPITRFEHFARRVRYLFTARHFFLTVSLSRRRPTPNQSPELSARLFRAPPGVYVGARASRAGGCQALAEGAIPCRSTVACTSEPRPVSMCGRFFSFVLALTLSLSDRYSRELVVRLVNRSAFSFSGLVDLSPPWSFLSSSLSPNRLYATLYSSSILASAKTLFCRSARVFFSLGHFPSAYSFRWLQNRLRHWRGRTSLASAGSSETT